jgi:hypothetical protein
MLPCHHQLSSILTSARSANPLQLTTLIVSCLRGIQLACTGFLCICKHQAIQPFYHGCAHCHPSTSLIGSGISAPFSSLSMERESKSAASPCISRESPRTAQGSSKSCSRQRSRRGLGHTLAECGPSKGSDARFGARLYQS